LRPTGTPISKRSAEMRAKPQRQASPLIEGICRLCPPSYGQDARAIKRGSLFINELDVHCRGSEARRHKTKPVAHDESGAINGLGSSWPRSRRQIVGPHRHPTARPSVDSPNGGDSVIGSGVSGSSRRRLSYRADRRLGSHRFCRVINAVSWGVIPMRSKYLRFQFFA
jgi:hypothetical protein